VRLRPWLRSSNRALPRVSLRYLLGVLEIFGRGQRARTAVVPEGATMRPAREWKLQLSYGLSWVLLKIFGMVCILGDASQAEFHGVR
jgi:hypothetical protein